MPAFLVLCRLSGKKCHLPRMVLPLGRGIATMILPAENACSGLRIISLANCETHKEQVTGLVKGFSKHSKSLR